MVDYRGPALVRPLVEAMDIPIFHRVKQIHFTLENPNKITIDRPVIDRLHRLAEVSVTKFSAQGVNATDINASDIEAIASTIPPCRLAAVQVADNQINIRTHPGNGFLGCPQ